jgi:hypothetical protein
MRLIAALAALVAAGAVHGMSTDDRAACEAQGPSAVYVEPLEWCVWIDEEVAP